MQQNFIQVNKKILKSLGPKEAIVLGFLMKQYERYTESGEKNGGWVRASVRNIQEFTNFSKYHQKKAINKLKECGLIETKFGSPTDQRYVKINDVKLLNFLGGI